MVSLSLFNMKYTSTILKYSTKSSYKSANVIRSEFLDYFTKDLQHVVVRSSPVSLLNDHTTAFVNAGMNQFKGVFLGYYDPPATKVANSQKCIRVGGKHNDYDNVGNDSYHHTFFEMLGNWSFGNYFKKESCQYALNLLTGPYNIKKEFLYVTYFNGDEKLGLEPDLECKEIWLSLGIPESKILSFGIKENFWEMGLSGPCGPCTEIHVDVTMQSTNQREKVNQGLSDLIELWNIVFIQYERLPDNQTIVPLPKYHVDTGMGFERLVALLQGKRSNYDTDLFQPLFQAIQHNTNAPEYKGLFGKEDKNNIDYSYRILADHARMVTVALSDNVLPEENHRLRRILRQGVSVAENVFKKKDLLSELTYTVADSLGDAYPKLHDKITEVRTIIKYEEDLFRRLRDTCGKEWKKIVATRPELNSISDWMAPGLINGYKDLQSTLKKDSSIRTLGILPGHVAFKLYDTYGLNIGTITELAKVESLHFDKNTFEKEMENARLRSKVGITKNNNHIRKESVQLLKKNNVSITDDSYKYDYIFDHNNYTFPKLESKLVALIINGNCVMQEELHTILLDKTDVILNNNNEIGVILNKTVCYSFEGGQMSDKGTIFMKNLQFEINKVEKIENYVIHFGKFIKNHIKTMDTKLKDCTDCIIFVDPEIRIGAMRHHTATHLLNAALKLVLLAIYQRSSAVSVKDLKFQFNSFGEQITLDHLTKVEDIVNKAIKANACVTNKILNLLELLAEDNLTTLPGEIYPHTGIRIIEIRTDELNSKEPCCGTHVKNTSYLEHFCIFSYTSRGSSNRVIRAAAGPLAKAARETGDKLLLQVAKLEDDIKNGNFKDFHKLHSRITDIKQKLTEDDKFTSVPLPFVVKQECSDKVEKLYKDLWKQEKNKERYVITTEITDLMNRSDSFIVHHLKQATMHHSLHEITSFFPNMPILVISHNNTTIKAHCCVPQEFVSDKFNARKWMEVLLRVFDAKYGPIKTRDSLVVASMKSTNVSEFVRERLMKTAITETTKFANIHLHKVKLSKKS